MVRYGLYLNPDMKKLTGKKKYETIGEILIPSEYLIILRNSCYTFGHDNDVVIKLRWEKTPLGLNAETFTEEMECLGLAPR